MNLGEFRRFTADMPDETELLYRDMYGVWHSIVHPFHYKQNGIETKAVVVDRPIDLGQVVTNELPGSLG
jgi:hypothetical protein